MAQIETVTATESREVINGIIERDGVVVIDSVLSEAQLRILDSELKPHFTQRPHVCNGQQTLEASARSNLKRQLAACRLLPFRNLLSSHESA